jgi:uncharacterized protein
MDEFAMLDNIRDHSIVVAQVSGVLLSGMEITEDTQPPRDLVIAGALLHDIAKTQCIKERCDHSKLGCAICVDLGYPEIGEIVQEHVILADFPVERFRQGIFLAKEIVHYADKRVLHNQVVSLDTRLEYIIKRYGDNDVSRHTLIRKNFRRCQDLEDFLFAHIRYTPEDLPLLAPQFSLLTD